MRKPTRSDIIRLSVVLALYFAFLVWVKSWMGLIVVPLIVDNYITKIIPWGWWKKTFPKYVMSEEDTTLLALIVDNYITKRIPWGWGKKLSNTIQCKMKSWMCDTLLALIVDYHKTKRIPREWWIKLRNAILRSVMSWVDAIVFALIAVYFVNLYFFQNYVIPTSSLEKSLLVGDYLFVSKMSYGPRKPQTPLSMPLTQHTMPVTGTKSYLDCIQWPYERVAGLGDIELNDIVVFNYPAGDTVVSNPEVIDYYAECYLIGESRYPNKPQMDSLTPERQRAAYDNIPSSLARRCGAPLTDARTM